MEHPNSVSDPPANSRIYPEEIPPDDEREESNNALKWIFVSVGGILLLALLITAVPYWILARRVDKQLDAGPFLHTYSYYAEPVSIAAGDQESPQDVVTALRRAGLRESNSRESGTFSPTRQGLIVRTTSPVEVDFDKNRIQNITDLSTRRRLPQLELPPQLITNLSSEGRARRIILHYSDMPPALIHAVVSIEDKRFFKHDGIDVFRMVKAFYVDMKEQRKEQGASTITMQLARNLWLDRNKSWTRKFSESLITLHLEHKLSKRQILEYYSNQVYLGTVGTFSINGFGEAARAYFSKDVHNLTLTEAATLAGLIQRPSYFNPLRYPDRAMERRNLVLNLMRDNGYITDAQYDAALAAPLGLHPAVNDLSQTQYFLDMASDQVQHGTEDHDGGSANAYTTLDPRLQRAAEQAVHDGMQLVDRELAASRKRAQPAGAPPQVALIAMDPHTGDVKALVGGRDYTASQLNRVLAKRPPGSVFKPFVYTAALNTALEGGDHVFTPASTILDAPTTFEFNNATYAPSNFKNQFMGQVTLRQALAHSLNVATVKLAEQIGYDRVVAMARRAGFNENIQATPSVALGSYQVTPLEIASAYTIFANGGTRVKPNFVSSVRTQEGGTLYQADARQYPALDPRVAFIMTDMLEEVLRSGTGAAVRGRGFTLPAAGKTGTSHDGWFAGYTSQLLCVVWVGYDDYRELGLEGARSALPIWTEFMMDAARYHEYRDARPFTAPAGVVKASACGGAADYYIEGTQPPACPPPDHVFFPAGEADRSIPPLPEQSSQAIPVTPARPFNAPPRPAAPPQPRVQAPPQVQTSMPVRTPPPQVQPPLPVRTPPPAQPSMPVRTPPPRPPGNR